MSDDVLAISTLSEGNADQSPDHPTGDGYPDDIRDAAFQFWAFRAGRKAEHVISELIEVCSDLGYATPSIWTIKRWAKHGQWEQRANALIRELAPAIDQQDAANLFLTRGKAISALDDVLERRLPARERMAALMAARLAFESTGIIKKDGTPGLAASVTDLPTQSTIDDDPTLSHTDRQRRLLDRSRGRTS